MPGSAYAPLLESLSGDEHINLPNFNLTVGEHHQLPRILDVSGNIVYQHSEKTGALPRKPERILRRPDRDLHGELDLAAFKQLCPNEQKQVMCHLQYAKGLYSDPELIDPLYKEGDYDKMLRVMDKRSSDPTHRSSPPSC